MMLVQLSHKSTNLRNLTDLDDQRVGWMTVEWAGSGKPVGEFGQFAILSGHTLADLCTWLAEQHEHLVEAIMFAGQHGPELAVDKSADLAEWACSTGLISVAGSAGSAGSTSLVVTACDLGLYVQRALLASKSQQRMVCYMVLKACRRRWCKLTAGWAKMVLSARQFWSLHITTSLAKDVIGHLTKSDSDSDLRDLLVAALTFMDMEGVTLHYHASGLATRYLEDADVLRLICTTQKIHRAHFWAGDLVQALLSRLDLKHCVEQLDYLCRVKHYRIGHIVWIGQNELRDYGAALQQHIRSADMHIAQCADRVLQNMGDTDYRKYI